MLKKASLARSLAQRNANPNIPPGFPHKPGPRYASTFDDGTYGYSGYTGTTTSSRMRNYASYLNAVTIPTVLKALTQIAQNAASCEITWLGADGSPVDIKTKYPDLHYLYNHPNSEQNGEEFRYMMICDDQLVGNGIIAMDSFNEFNEPTELFRLRPDKVEIRRAPDGTKWYTYEAAYGDEPVVYMQHEIQHVKQWNPRDPYWGLGVIEGGEIAFSADRRLNEFKYDYFDRGAVPFGVLTTDNDMSDDEHQRLLARWRATQGGGRMTPKTAFLSQGTSYQAIQEPLGNVPIVELTKMGRNDILELFGVPPQSLGDFSGSNYRNAESAKAFFWHDTMLPILKRWENFWTAVGQLFDPHLTAEYNRREIIDFNLRAQTTLWLSQTASFTRNDLRTAAGFDPFPDDDPVGRVIVNTGRSSELFPSDYAEPVDLLPLTTSPDDSAYTSDPQWQKIPDSEKQQEVDDSSADVATTPPITKKPPAANAKPVVGKKSFHSTRLEIAASQPRYPSELISRRYKALLKEIDRPIESVEHRSTQIVEDGIYPLLGERIEE